MSTPNRFRSELCGCTEVDYEECGPCGYCDEGVVKLCVRCDLREEDCECEPKAVAA